MIADEDEFTPAPVISHAILTHNRGRSQGLAGGIVMTPPHNPPQDGGFKYNPPHGGPAGPEITDWIQTAENRFPEARLGGVKRVTHAKVLGAATTHRYDFLDAYTSDLASVIDFDVIRSANIAMGVDPLGGAGVHYWTRIAERFRPDLTKWLADGLLDASLGFAGEQNAGASFLRHDGTVWTTNKDDIAAALLAAEITARLGRDPGEICRELAAELGTATYARKDAPANSRSEAGIEAPLERAGAAHLLAGEALPASAGSTSLRVHAFADGLPGALDQVPAIQLSGGETTRLRNTRPVTVGP